MTFYFCISSQMSCVDFKEKLNITFDIFELWLPKYQMFWEIKISNNQVIPWEWGGH